MTTHQLVVVMFDLALILAAARVLGAGAQRLGQPAVIGEIVAGILVGPTVLNGAIGDALFPRETRPLLGVLANVGVALFMFVVGLELDHIGQDRQGVAVSVALGCTLLPLGLGCLLALHLAGNLAGDRRVAFVLFLGVAMSVTAFPVLARILTDRGLLRIDLGRRALASAALCDVLAWSLLAVAVAVANHSGHSAWWVLLAAPYAAFVLLAVRPLLRYLMPRLERPETALALALAGAFASGGLTEWMGLHFIFGTFLFGIAMPRRPYTTPHELVSRVSHLTLVLLLPVYFVTAGMRVDLSGLHASDLGRLGLIMLVAVSGKGLGTLAAARLHGLDLRTSAALAALMNTRGLTELVVLTIGLDLGIIGPSLYSLMVVMAVTTTGLTGPLLRLIYPQRYVDRDLAAERQRDASEARVPT